MNKSKRNNINMGLLILDWITVFGSFWIAYLVLLSLDGLFDLSVTLLSNSALLVLSVVGSTLMVISLLMMNLHNREFCILDLPSNRIFTRALPFAILISILPILFARQNDNPGLQAVVTMCIIPISLLIQRSANCAIGGSIFQKQKIRSKLLVIGNGNVKDRLHRWADYYKLHGYDTVGIIQPTDLFTVDIQSTNPDGDVPEGGGYSEDYLHDTIASKAVDEVWISDKNLPANNVRTIINTCRSEGVEVALAPDIGDWAATELEVIKLDGLPVIRTKKTMGRPFYAFTKRLIDIIAATVLIILLSPIYLLITIWIKLDSKGPVTFKQQRVGENGKLFNMFKFRSMYTDADPYAVSPNTSEDARITRAGRFLRRSSLDELPQLYNVLRGDISLVGPRPEMPFVVDTYDEHQRIRLSVKQGITGLWQVAADRGRPIHENLQYDLYYIENRSLILDLAILWRTAWTAAKGI